MVALASQINTMVEQLQEPEQKLLVEIIKRVLPDDVATPDDLMDIASAREEYDRGETINEDDINWD
ncbi:MAG: hypothetical protein LBR83_00155 [Clostridiales bacterium]|jgi:hypothetical protein|nr:hypothetical protein [Clostridiales bacterium]